MIVKIFWQKNCPKCPPAKKLGESLKKEGMGVELHNIQDVNGLAEATFFDVLATPTVLIAEGDKEIISWRDKLPTLKEVKDYLEKKNES